MTRGGVSSYDKNYAFRFSCHHDEVGNEHATCHVTVKFFDFNEYNFYTRELNGVCSCGTEKCIRCNGHDGHFNLNYIEMETDCGDALLINYAKLRTETLSGDDAVNSSYDFNDYGDSGHGFNCLSTDADDWKTSGKGYRIEPCRSCYRFKLNTAGFWIC